MRQINWTLVIDGVDYTVHPSYSESSAEISESRYEGQYFRRKSLESSLRLTSHEASYVIDADYGAEMFIYLRIDDVVEFVGRFYKRDCTIKNEQYDKSCSFTPKPYDKYTKLLDGAEIKQKIASYVGTAPPVSYSLRPTYQVYVSGTQYVTSIQGGATWETEVNSPYSYFTGEVPLGVVTEITPDSPSDNRLQRDWGFGPPTQIMHISGVDLPFAEKLSPDVSGTYEYENNMLGGSTIAPMYLKRIDSAYNVVALGGLSGNGVVSWNKRCFTYFVANNSPLTDDDFGSTWQALNGEQFRFVGTNIINGDKRVYFIRVTTDTLPSSAGGLTHVSGGVSNGTFGYSSHVFNPQDSSTFFMRLVITENDDDVLYLGEDIKSALDWRGGSENGNGNEDILDFSMERRFVSRSSGDVAVLSARHIHARVVFNEQKLASREIVDDDLIALNDNYRWVQPTSAPIVQVYDAIGDTDLYGKYAESSGPYSNKPIAAIPNETLSRIARSDSRYLTLWVSPLANIDVAATNIELNDSYSIPSIIQTMISDYDDSISFERTAEYSQFLFAASNPLGFNVGEFRLTPKSNILFSRYSRAATNGELSFLDLMQILNQVACLHWHIDESNRLIIEHKAYYLNGGSYSSVRASDLTNTINGRTQKGELFDTAEWSYVQGKQPERRKFSWMDDVSEAFNGTDLVYEGPYVDKENQESVTVAKVTTDVDYMLNNSNSVSKEGFAMIEVENNKIPFREIVFLGSKMLLQNGGLSAAYIQAKYYLYGSHTETMQINGSVIEAKSLVRDREQEIEHYPLKINNPIGLVRSTIGVGEIISVKTNFETFKRSLILNVDHE